MLELFDSGLSADNPSSGAGVYVQAGQKLLSANSAVEWSQIDTSGRAGVIYLCPRRPPGLAHRVGTLPPQSEVLIHPFVCDTEMLQASADAAHVLASPEDSVSERGRCNVLKRLDSKGILG